MKNILLVLALFLLIPTCFIAAEIEAHVSVNMEQLNQEQQINVSSMQGDVESYLNSTQFTDIEWEGPAIPVDVAIFLTGGNGYKYSARVFISAKRYLYGSEGATVTVNFIDDKWSFEYARNAVFSYDPNRFHEFSSLLDFYMLLIIGMDADTYEDGSGYPIYEKAKNVVRLGSNANANGFETYSQPGDFTRYNLVNELTDPTYDPFKTLVFEYYVDGLDQMSVNKDEATAVIAEIISDMAEFKKNKLVRSSMFVSLWFATKYRELATLFEGYKDTQVFQDLIYLDPTNSSVYIEAQDAK
jgi:hypothetical protein